MKKATQKINKKSAENMSQIFSEIRRGLDQLRSLLARSENKNVEWIVKLPLGQISLKKEDLKKSPREIFLVFADKEVKRIPKHGLH